MKTIYFNRQTLLGESQTPVSLAVNVDDTFNMTKDVQEVYKMVQKTNDIGENLYYKDIYKTATEEVFVGYDETLNKTDLPCMVTVQVKDEDGNKLYTENICDDEGNVVDTFTTTKAVNEDYESNTPIMEEVQKTSDKGNLVYLKPIIKTIEYPKYDHTEEVTEETDRPVMVENLAWVSKDLIHNPECFSIHEVLREMYLNIVNNSTYDYIIGEMFLSEDDIELDKSFANTGVGIVQLPPKGNVQFKPIELEAPSNKFKVVSDIPEGMTMYINGKKIKDGLVELSSVTTSIKVKFYNSTGNFLDVNAFTILYSKYVEEVVEEVEETPVKEEVVEEVEETPVKEEEVTE